MQNLRAGILPRRSSSPYHNAGTILIVSIWVLMFFSVLSAGLYKIIYSHIRLTKVLEERIICKYSAKAASIYAQIEKRKDATAYDTLYELRIPREKELGRGKFTYTIIDEESKVNINTAPCEVIARLPGLNLELAQSIIASELRPFRLKEEILLVEDITEEIYSKCRDFITIYTDGEVNINTAAGEVLKALGFDDSLISIIKSFRAGEDTEEATLDDGVFENTQEIMNKLRAFKGALTGAQEAHLVQIVTGGSITTASKNLSLQIQTEVSGRPAMRYAVVIDKDKIKEWREY